MELPALKKLSPDQFDEFQKNMDVLIKADGKIDLFEYTISSLLLRQLNVHFGRAKPTAMKYHRLDPVLPSLVGVISTLAYAGQDTEDEVQAAFDKGIQAVERSASLLPKSECTLKNLDAALKILAQTTPIIKKQVLESLPLIDRKGELKVKLSKMDVGSNTRLLIKEIQDFKFLDKSKGLSYLVEDAWN